MATIDDISQLVKHNYGCDPQKPGENEIVPGTNFKMLQLFPNGNKFPYDKDFGSAYINEKARQIVYTSRGSITGGDWLLTDPGIAFQYGAKERTADAVANLKSLMDDPKYKCYKFIAVGHSMGGYIAKGAVTNLERDYPKLIGVSINSPGDKHTVSKNILELNNQADLASRFTYSQPNRISLKVEDDPLSWEGFARDPIRWIGDLFNTPKRNHGIEGLEKEVEKKNLGKFELNEIIIDGSDTQKKFLEGIQKNDKEGNSFIRLNGNTVQGNEVLPELPTLAITYSGKEGEEQHAEGFGLTFKVPLDWVKGIEDGWNGVTNFFSGKTEHTIEKKDGENLAKFKEREDGSLEKVEPVPTTEPKPSLEPVPQPPPPDKQIELLRTFTQSDKITLNETDMQINVVKDATNPSASDIEKLRSSIKALNGVRIEYGGFKGAFSLLLLTIHPTSAFFRKAVEMGGLEQSGYLSLMFGSWLKPTDKPLSGDIVLAQSLFLTDTEGWGVLLDFKNENDVAVLMADGNGYNAKIAEGIPIKISKGWRPAFKQVLEENSPIGEFWGPMMIQMKRVLESANGSSSINDFTEMILRQSGYKAANFDDFMGQIAAEIKPITTTDQLQPGNIVFGKEPVSMGIWLSSYKVFGVLDGYGVKYYNTEEFEPDRVWSPHKKKA